MPCLCSRSVAASIAPARRNIGWASSAIEGVTRISEPGPSRDHSERMLAYLGAPLFVDGRRTTATTTRSWQREAASKQDRPTLPSPTTASRIRFEDDILFTPIEESPVADAAPATSLRSDNPPPGGTPARSRPGC